MSTIIKGTAIAEAIYKDIASQMHARHRHVHVRGVIVGHDAASIAYQNLKEQACSSCGFEYSRSTFAETISQADLIRELRVMNDDPAITGIIIQLPLPNHINRDVVLGTIDQPKDIDAFFYTSGQVDTTGGLLRPPTPVAMLKLLQATGQTSAGRQIVIVGNGFLVGQPLAMMLRDQNIKTTVIDSDSSNRLDQIKQADILFTGVGKANLITPDMVKPGVIIIDAGYSRVEGKTHGDVDERCADKASYMTPAIGGVGPLTVAVLMRNALVSSGLQERAQ